jgi:5'-nucleotidase
MNQGENLSEDIFFSGTCGGAFAGYLYSIPSLAVSLISDKKSYSQGIFNYAKGVEITGRVLSRLFGFSHNRGVFNLNIPYDADGTIAITRLGYKRYKPNIIERTDPRGNLYYWIGTGNPEYQGEENTDVWAVTHQFSSLTLLKYDLNREEEFRLLTQFFHEKAQ